MYLLKLKSSISVFMMLMYTQLFVLFNLNGVSVLHWLIQKMIHTRTYTLKFTHIISVVILLINNIKIICNSFKRFISNKKTIKRKEKFHLYRDNITWFKNKHLLLLL